MDETADKECGTCSVCCEVLAVEFPDHKKPAGKRCEHQNPHGGCKVYEDRPSACSRFYCAWHLLQALPENCRPDRLGILFQYVNDDEHWSPFSKNCIVAYADSDPTAFKSRDALACYRMFWNGGTPVWLHGMDGKNVLVDEDGRKIAGSRYGDYLTKLKEI